MPDGKDYIAKTYQALKDNLEGFNKTEQEYRQLISTDGEYRKRVYSALRDNLEGFNRTEDDFYVQLGIKKKSGGGGSQSGATGTSVDPAAQQYLQEVTQYLNRRKGVQQNDNTQLPVNVKQAPDVLRTQIQTQIKNDKFEKVKQGFEKEKLPAKPSVNRSGTALAKALQAKYGAEWRTKATPQEKNDYTIADSQERYDTRVQFEQSGAPTVSAPTPEELRQKQIQKDADEFYDTPLGKLYWNVLKPVGGTAERIIGNTAAAGTRLIGNVTGTDEVTDGIADYIAEAFNPDEWYKDRVTRITPTAMKGGLFNNGKINTSLIVPKLAETLTTMYALTQGGGGNAGLFTRSFLMTEEDYRKDGREAGLKGQDLDMYAYMGAGLTSMLEPLSPNNLITGKAKKTAAKEFYEAIQNGFSREVALKNATKTLVKETGMENVQEFTQMLADKANRYFTDKMSGKPTFNDDLSWEGVKDEVYETLFLTTGATTLLSSPQTLRNAKPTTLEKSAWYNAALNPDQFSKYIERSVSKGQLNQEQAATIKTNFEKYRGAVEQAQRLGFSADQTVDIAFNIYKGQDISTQLKQINNSPVLKEAVGAPLKQEQQEIATDIKRVGLGVPEVGTEITGDELSVIIGNIGDKNDVTILQDKVTNNNYRVDEINVKELYNTDAAFKQYVDEYNRKEKNDDGLLVPAIVGTDGSIVDGRSRLAQQYLNGAETVQVFKELKSKNSENIEESRNSNNVANTQQPQQDGVENKQQIDDIEKRRQQDLYYKVELVPFVSDEDLVTYDKERRDFILEKRKQKKKQEDEINAKYDAELAALNNTPSGITAPQTDQTIPEQVQNESQENVLVPKGNGNWREEFNKTNDNERRNSILEAIAQLPTSTEGELRDVYNAAKSTEKNTNRINWALANNTNTPQDVFDDIINSKTLEKTASNDAIQFLINKRNNDTPPTTTQPVQPNEPAAQEQGTETTVPESADAVGQGDAAAAPAVLKDINGVDIQVGDTVTTRQKGGGILPAGEPVTGIVEQTKDSFGNDTLQIRYRKEGRDFDQFILLKGQINEVVNKQNTQDETGNISESERGSNEQPQSESEAGSVTTEEAGGTVNETAPTDAEQVPQPAVSEQDAGVVPPQPPTEDATDTEENDDLDYLANNIKSIADVGKYMSGATIEKHTGEAPTNDQTIQSQDLLSALESGVAIIDKAKEMWGDKYVENMLDYIEKSTAGVSNKALMYVSLENAVNADLAAFPERETELRKLLEQVYTESQAYLREASLAINFGRLRRFARTGYNLSQITDNFFAPEERAARVTITEAVQAPIADVQKMYEEQLQANEDLKKRNDELEKRVAKQYGDTRIRERKIKLADKLDKIADRIGNFGRVSSDITQNSLAPDIQKYVADAIRYVAAEIRTGKEIPKAIVDAAKKFANDKLAPDFLKKQIEDGLKEAGFTAKEITKTTDELKEDKQRRDAILEFKDKNGRTPKEIITDALIQKGFSKTTTIKGEKRQILDWRKLAGRAGTEEEIKRNVEEVVKSIEGLKDEVEFAQDLFVQEIIDLRESIINKSLTELKRKNRDAVTAEQRSAARRLAELYSFGLFDKAEDEFDNALNKAAGINLTQENYSAAKDIARGLERIYVTSFKGGNLNDISAKFAIENLNNQLRLLLIDETKKQGSNALRIANIVRSYFDVSQTMVLMSLKQTVENPLSGLQANVLESIEDVLSKSSTSEQRKQRLTQMSKVAIDMIAQGGLGYGDVENLFVNRKHLDDNLNAIAGKNKIAHTIMSGISGRITLNTMDAMFKFSITEKKFTHNLIKILTDKTNPNRMEKEDAVKFVSEQLTGQTFEEAKKTAQETIKFINKDAGKELIPDNPISVERFANDIVKGALMMGGKLTAEQIKAAYNAAYRSAGLNIGHVSNNFLSKMIVGGSAQIESKISLAIKRKQWGRAAAYTYYSIFFRNILNPFVGGGTNWLVIRFEKMGGGLLTGLTYNLAAKDYQLDLTNANDVKSIEDSLYRQSRAKDSFMRGLIGGTISWSLYAAFKAIADDDDEKELRKWRNRNRWATRYTDILTPEPILASLQWNDKEVQRYVLGWFNKNDAFDPIQKLSRASQYSTKGQDGKTWGAAGEILGMNFHTPLPWRMVKDGVVIYQGLKGQDPYHGDYNPSSGFLNGVFQGGFIEFLGYRPERQKNK